MRQYGDISIQYRNVEPQYISWPSAIYRNTTLTFVIRGSHCVVNVFSVFDRFIVFLLDMFCFLILSFYYFFMLVHENKSLKQILFFKTPVVMDLDVDYFLY